MHMSAGAIVTVLIVLALVIVPLSWAAGARIAHRILRRRRQCEQQWAEAEEAAIEAAVAEAEADERARDQW